MTFKPNKSQQGLTLLEMIVVLMIAAMAVALGFQSLGQWRRANDAIRSVSGMVLQSSLTEEWLKASLRSLTPVEDPTFKGEATVVAGVALQPTLTPQGGTTTIRWEIQSDPSGWSLVLQENDTQTVLPLPGTVRATFAYLDKEGREYEQWPPALGLHDHLPAVVALRQELDSGQNLLWTSAIGGIRNPAPRLFEAERD